MISKWLKNNFYSIKVQNETYDHIQKINISQEFDTKEKFSKKINLLGEETQVINQIGKNDKDNQKLINPITETKKTNFVSGSKANIDPLLECK